MFFSKNELGKLWADCSVASSRAVLFECKFRSALRFCLCVGQCPIITKKETRGLRTSCVKHYREDTPKYVVHVLGGAVSNKHRLVSRTETTDTFI